MTSAPDSDPDPGTPSENAARRLVAQAVHIDPVAKERHIGAALRAAADTAAPTGDAGPRGETEVATASVMAPPPSTSRWGRRNRTILAAAAALLLAVPAMLYAVTSGSDDEAADTAERTTEADSSSAANDQDDAGESTSSTAAANPESANAAVPGPTERSLDEAIIGFSATADVDRFLAGDADEPPVAVDPESVRSLDICEQTTTSPLPKLPEDSSTSGSVDVLIDGLATRVYWERRNGERVRVATLDIACRVDTSGG